MRFLPTALAGLAGATMLALGGPSGAPAPTQSLAPTAGQVARTERFLERRAACLGCHVIGGRGGAIGPQLDGLADRAEARYVRDVILDPQGTIPGTLMPRQALPEREIEPLVAYLLSLPEPSSAPGDAVPQAPPALEDPRSEDGPALYARHCAACHGASGGGDGWNAANLPVAPTAHADADLMSARTDDALYDAIHAGAFVLDGSARMPGFGEMLSHAQIRALVGHIRVLCDCAQPDWADGP